MRLTDIKKAGRYFIRIVKNPFSKQSCFALKRYMGESFVFIGERFRGLDFTMVYQCEGSEHNNNYSKSPRKVLKRIFEEIDFAKEHGFLDLGCGKGYVMAEACKYPFKSVGGVEYTEQLCNICERNLEILGLKEQVELFHCDARDFNDYGNYDIFYFCNPFDETVLSEVAKKIYESHKNSRCVIYYLNPHQEERQRAILHAGFHLTKTMPDENEQYFDIRVYEN